MQAHPRSLTIRRPQATGNLRRKAEENQTMTTFTLANGDIYTSDNVLTDHVLVVEDGFVKAIRPRGAEPAGEVIDLSGQCVAPGFIDVQVNGGGDVLFND